MKKTIYCMILLVILSILSGCEQKQKVPSSGFTDSRPPTEINELANLISKDTAKMMEKAYVVIGNNDADWLFKMENGQLVPKYMYVTHVQPYPVIAVICSIGFLALGIGVFLRAKDKLEENRWTRKHEKLEQEYLTAKANKEYMEAAMKFQEEEARIKTTTD